jgi:hypothetical protein
MWFLLSADVSEERIAFIVRVTRNGELVSYHPEDGGDMFLRNVVLTRATLRNIPEDDILHSHSREQILHKINLLSSVAET